MADLSPERKFLHDISNLTMKIMARVTKLQRGCPPDTQASLGQALQAVEELMDAVHARRMTVSNESPIENEVPRHDRKRVA